MAQTSGDLTAAGSVTLSKPPTDTLLHVALSGTYGTCTFAIEGSADGTNFAPLSALLKSTGTIVSGTLSPTDNDITIWDVPCAGLTKVRARAITVGSGTMTFNLLSYAYVGVPVLNTFAATALGAATGTSCVVTAGLNTSGSTGAGLGYITGAGGAQTQASTRATTVVLNKLCGAITTDTTSLAAGAEATFTLTNSTIAAGDVVVVSLKTPSSTGLSIPAVTTTAAGSCQITLTNVHGSTADTSASVINFAVIKAVAA